MESPPKYCLVRKKKQALISEKIACGGKRGCAPPNGNNNLPPKPRTPLAGPDQHGWSQQCLIKMAASARNKGVSLMRNSLSPKERRHVGGRVRLVVSMHNQIRIDCSTH